MLACQELDSYEKTGSPNKSLHTSIEDSKMIIQVSHVVDGQIKYLINYKGVQWFVLCTLTEVQYIVSQLRESFPNLVTFSKNRDLTEDFLGLQIFDLTHPKGLELVSNFMQQLAQFEAVRSDPKFRALL